MKRRELVTVASLALSGITGCVQFRPPSADRRINELSSSVTVSNRECNAEVNECTSEVTFSDDAQINVSGSITAAKTCDELTASTYSSLNDRVSEKVIVELRTVPGQNSTCEECSAVFDYSASFTFDRGPETVRVEHELPDGRVETIGEFDRSG